MSDTRPTVDWRPIPDPTLLTTEQLRRELSGLRELIEARLNGMDKTHLLLSAMVEKANEENQKKRDAMRDLFNERFLSIQKQFEERDIRTNSASTAAQVAVNAALQAQKEAAAAQNDSNLAAIGKSEMATMKQLDSIGALLASNTKATDDKIALINGRLDRTEGVSRGAVDTRTEGRLGQGAIIAMIVAAVSVISLVITWQNLQSHSAPIVARVPVEVGR